MMEKIFIFNTIDLIITGITVALFVIQAAYYVIVYFRPYKKMKSSDVVQTAMREPVSVIVYAKNESFNLEKYLPSLLAQDYPEYEVIVINDGSTDESDNLLKIMEGKYPHLYHTFIPQESKYISRKKLALTVGIKAAKYGLLLFTEANCKPLSKRWIATMARHYTGGDAEIVLGFCAYRKYKGFFHKLVGYDNLMSGLQYLTSALAGSPYTGNGRNLSYRKALFFEHKGYHKSLNLHAGDDDLFINELATKENTRIEYAQDSITEMAAIDCFAVWKEMKISRAATQRYYRGKTLLFFRMERASCLLFLSAVVAAIAASVFHNPLVAVAAVLLYLVLFAVKAVVLHKSATMLRQKMWVVWLPLLEIAQSAVHIYIHIYRLFWGKKDYTFNIK
ncbi:MAG: glycosyltransferase [Tannerellaceae bacterium]|jgi:glycosyltransferase involved in cell wall biosynthesis|nr:glycosyltransferase [Tannerellaceae bacterium]